MSNIMRTAIILLGLFCVLPAQSGKIVGTVLDRSSHEAVSKARVKIIELELQTTSGKDGKFEFDEVPAGKYRIVVTHLKYVQRILPDVIVQEGRVTKVTVYLTKHPPDLDTHRMKPQSAGKGEKQIYEFFSTHKDKAGGEKQPGIPVPPPLPPRKESRTLVTESSAPPSESGLKAGYADDNRQFNYFLNFLKQYGPQAPHYPLEIEERIHLRILDKNGKSLPGSEVRVYAVDQLRDSGLTYADGSYFIYPLEMDTNTDHYQVYIHYGQFKKKLTVRRNGPRLLNIRLETSRQSFVHIPMDILFILDATGSMGEEIERLKSTIDIIKLNLISLNIKPKIRFGMVLYRDRDDDFDVKKVPFTDDLQQFSEQLRQVRAEGGGDTPEDLQAALEKSMRAMSWNKQGLHLAFLITDAPPHLDYGQAYTYADAARDARQMAIKIFTIGTGGLDISGEYVLRQIAQFTYGKYIFLTYGEKGESEGGRPGSVSHHTGTNFQSEKLESIIIRFAKQELSYLSEQPIEEALPYFRARKIKGEKKEATLRKLFSRAIQELKDYSSIAIPAGTDVSVIPIVVKHESLANNAEYFTEQLTLAMSKDATFKMVERQDFQFIAKETGLQLSGIVEPKDAAKVGAFIGADMLVIGRMYFKDGLYELFLKLVRVESAEVVSVTKIKIDPQLGL